MTSFGEALSEAKWFAMQAQVEAGGVVELTDAAIRSARAGLPVDGSRIVGMAEKAENNIQSANALVRQYPQIGPQVSSILWVTRDSLDSSERRLRQVLHPFDFEKLARTIKTTVEIVDKIVTLYGKMKK
ncbi:hypothetical protein [Streptomyces sp. NPDC001348]